MPLVAATLASQLQSLFENPPPNAAGCAQGWANAMQAYVSSVVPPSTTVAAAASALASSLATPFSGPNAAPAMEIAFTAFALSVGGGMAGAGFAATPPPAPVGFAPLFAGPKPTTHSDAAQGIASQIDTWMKTGVATLIAPPFTVSPWS